MDRQQRRRRRPALSCLECRRRKIKCDRNEPCTHCVSAKIECTYKFYPDSVVDVRQSLGRSALPSAASPSASAVSSITVGNQHVLSDTRTADRRRHDQYSRHGPEIPLPENLVHPWGPRATAAARNNEESLPSVSQPQLNDSATGTRNCDTTQHQTGTVPTPNHHHQPQNEDAIGAASIQSLLQRIRKLEEASAVDPAHALSETTQDIIATRSGLDGSQTVLDKSRMLRWSHWMGTAPEFSLVGDCYIEVLGHSKDFSMEDAEIQALLVKIGNGLQKCKSLARRIKLGRPTRCLSWREFSLSTPPRDVADTMVNLYFESFESAHRILHIPTFWAEYQKYWNDPERTTPDVRLKVLLVIAIGSSVSQYSDTDPGFRNMVHQWVYTAQAWLSGPLEKDRLNINGLQVHCLGILARQAFAIGGDLVWMSMGSLIHRAMQMGLHRDPKHLQKMSVLESEIRRRLWATILEMVLQASLDSAMPPRISLDDFDTLAPSNINDDEVSEETTTATLNPHPRSTYTSASIQLLLLDSLPTRLRILQLLNGLHSELSYAEALALTSSLTETRRAHGTFIKENRASGITPFHRNLLDYLVRRFVIVLHCPFVSKARTNPLFHYSLKASLDAAMSVISPEPDKGFSHLMTIGGGLFREGLWHAQTAICIELLAEVEAQAADGTLHRKSAYHELLKQAVRDMMALFTERIRHGESNIKSHMFLTMVLAQAEAIETDASPRLRIAQGAIESLEICTGLLQSRVETSTATTFPSPMDMGLGMTGLGDDGTGVQGGYGYNGGGVGGLDLADLDLEFSLPDAGFS
ncbi:hypothetical protein PV08_05947 [Exophiala spinifera]|uniref:Zn(2)-C6 fungal-type domain-containing protein n=1 Tax=Exophiala spinifera TaxID=91928 RepID=A0A0D1ZSW9_9EURO|nr:uncharacterized protein PV08_05947 [Exophiala spinifera]KIW15897.1 hypothetical protein PV08_05947 [Exophiala spinifera]